MITINRRLGNRYVAFTFFCLMFFVALHFLSVKLLNFAPAFSPLLFPLLTSFLAVFHLFIACFMVMKYWCDKKRIYHLAIAFAFSGSTVLLFGTLKCFPVWLMQPGMPHVNYSGAMIFFLMRNVMMAVLLTLAAVLFIVRHHPLTRLMRHMIFAGLFLFTLTMVALAWFYSGHSELFPLDPINNKTRQFTVLWKQTINVALIILWLVALMTLLIITRLRNLFWASGTFLCVCYVIILVTLLPAEFIGSSVWYSARLFETAASLLIILTLLHDVFSLYRNSHLKYQQSYQNSIRDALTRLYNRSYFYESLNQALGKITDSHPVSVIVCDLDYFKRINDNYGHLQGDKVLQFVANLLMDSVRPQDITARIGGEEFVLLLSNTHSEAARLVAERIRLSLSSFDRFTTEGMLPEPITISMGIYTATTLPVTAEECLERADKAMYEAKETGRNRVVVYQENKALRDKAFHDVSRGFATR